jgi:hypothetical protein
MKHRKVKSGSREILRGRRSPVCGRGKEIMRKSKIKVMEQVKKKKPI